MAGPTPDPTDLAPRKGSESSDLGRCSVSGAYFGYGADFNARCDPPDRVASSEIDSATKAGAGKRNLVRARALGTILWAQARPIGCRAGHGRYLPSTSCRHRLELPRGMRRTPNPIRGRGVRSRPFLLDADRGVNKPDTDAFPRKAKINMSMSAVRCMGENACRSGIV